MRSRSGSTGRVIELITAGAIEGHVRAGVALCHVVQAMGKIAE